MKRLLCTLCTVLMVQNTGESTAFAQQSASDRPSWECIRLSEERELLESLGKYNLWLLPSLHEKESFFLTERRRKCGVHFFANTSEGLPFLTQLPTGFTLGHENSVGREIEELYAPGFRKCERIENRQRYYKCYNAEWERIVEQSVVVYYTPQLSRVSGSGVFVCVKYRCFGNQGKISE